MHVRTRLPVVIAVLVVLSALPGEAQKVEISPFAGLRFGGSATAETGIAYDLDTTSSYGLGLEFALRPEAHVQLLWSHQPTGFDRFSLDDDGRIELDIDYLHAGTTYVFDPSNRTRPFLGMTVGATLVSAPDEGVSATFFSFSIGGGVKLLVNDHVGIRLDGRLYGTWAGSGAFVVGCAGGCIVGFSGDFLWQGEATVGLVLGF